MGDNVFVTVHKFYESNHIPTSNWIGAMVVNVCKCLCPFVINRNVKLYMWALVDIIECECTCKCALTVCFYVCVNVQVLSMCLCAWNKLYMWRGNKGMCVIIYLLHWIRTNPKYEHLTNKILWHSMITYKFWTLTFRKHSSFLGGSISSITSTLASPIQMPSFKFQHCISKDQIMFNPPKNIEVGWTKV